MWVYGLDWTGSGQRQVADACECGNEPSGSVECGVFLDQLQTSQLLKKDSAPWSKYVSGNRVVWLGVQNNAAAWGRRSTSGGKINLTTTKKRFGALGNCPIIEPNDKKFYF